MLLIHRGREVHVRVDLTHIVEVAMRHGALLGRLLLLVLHHVKLRRRTPGSTVGTADQTIART